MNTNKNLRVRNYRNDYLSLSTKNVDIKERTWIKELKYHNISLLILNKGAHFEENSIFIAKLKETMDYLQKNHSTMSIVWRNTPHGHLNFAEKFNEPPLSTPPLLSELDQYNYSHFEEQNRLAQEFISNRYPSVLIMDVFTMTALRADSHRDPLHYCIPGPIDSWVLLFYNLLITIDKYAKKQRPQ
jgi:hypothetical protein